MTGNADQIAYWNEVAGSKWVAGQRQLDAVMAPLTAVVLEAAAVRRGESVLDVGCGCGETVLRCVEAAGPQGSILALDVSEPMLAQARRRATALAGAAPIEWRLADAATCPFVGDRDVALSRFGVMFFADPSAAFANLCASLKPGGRIAFLTWRRRDEVEWMNAPASWLADLAGPSPGSADGPGPFSLGDPAATCRLLRNAGLRDVASTPVDRALTLGADVDEATVLLMQHGPAARMVREGTAELRKRAEALLRERLRAHLGANGVAMGAACWLYTARAGGPITPP